MSQTLKVLTYNIHHGEGWCRDAPEFAGVTDLERIARIIRASGADIVALQEVDRNHSRSGRVDQPSVLAGLLDMNVCFGCNVRWADGSEYGLATLSRFHIRSWMNVALPGDNGLEPRSVLKSEIETPNHGTVVVLNTHLQYAGDGREVDAKCERYRQASAIAALMAELPGPVMLMGDFNAEPGDEELQPLGLLTDAWVETGDGGPGLTIPGHPMMNLEARIDIVFLNEALRSVSTRVFVEGEARYGSDHLPVVAETALCE